MLWGLVPVKALMITAGSARCCLTIITSICLYAMAEQSRSINSLGSFFCLLMMCFSHSWVWTQGSSLLSFSIPLPIPALRTLVFWAITRLLHLAASSLRAPIPLDVLELVSRTSWWCYSLCLLMDSLETSGFTEEIQTLWMHKWTEISVFNVNCSGAF